VYPVWPIWIPKRTCLNEVTRLQPGVCSSTIFQRSQHPPLACCWQARDQEVELWTRDLPLEVLIDMDRTAMQLRSNSSFLRLGSAVKRVSTRLLVGVPDQPSSASYLSLGSPQEEEGEHSGSGSPASSREHPSRQTVSESVGALSDCKAEHLASQGPHLDSTPQCKGSQKPCAGWLSWLLAHTKAEGHCSNHGLLSSMSSPLLLAALAHL
jgi:hypothetical protein